jgi:hypothetical protein
MKFDGALQKATQKIENPIPIWTQGNVRIV